MQCLVRQSIHQVDIKRLNTVRPQRIDNPRGFLKRLVTVDRRLDIGVEILNPDRNTGDAGARDGFDLFGFKPARIDLDGEFEIARNAKPLAPINSASAAISRACRMLGDPPPPM